MHACGHDIHITNLIGTARWFAANKDQWKGALIFLGQPAEERVGGAKVMIEEGLFTRFPRPDYAIALHCDSALATGKVGIRGGYALANVDSCDISMIGRGGHGAYPHTTIDPVVMGAQIVLDLQTIVSRETKPTDPAVVTVGSIHGGTKHNIIGNECHLQLTIRSYSDEVRKHIHDAIVRKAKAVAAGATAPEPKIVFSEGTPAMFNDEKLAARLRPVFERQFGKDNVDLVVVTHGKGLGLVTHEATDAIIKRVAKAEVDGVKFDACSYTCAKKNIADSDLLVRSTWYDGDAISVREALHLGTPVIATDNGMRPEGVDLVPPRDATALLDAITRRLTDPGPAPARTGARDNLQAVLDVYAELAR